MWFTNTSEQFFKSAIFLFLADSAPPAYKHVWILGSALTMNMVGEYLQAKVEKDYHIMTQSTFSLKESGIMSLHRSEV